jgi:hypothetical protein
MECSLAKFAHHLWSIPEGFATLLGATSTLIGAVFVIIGAAIAWRSVQQQIQPAEGLDASRRIAETSALEEGFKAELLVFSPGVLQATSVWNQRASQNPAALANRQFPVLIEPLYYNANIGKIGGLRHKWAAGALIGFYANLLELNTQSKEAMSGAPTVNATNQSVANRLRMMASNLSQALDGLNDDKKFGLQPEIRLDQLFMPDGRRASESQPVPASLQSVLLRLAGVQEPSVQTIVTPKSAGAAQVSKPWLRPSFLMALLSAALWGASAFVNIPYGIGGDPGSAYKCISALNALAALSMALSALLLAFGH